MVTDLTGWKYENCGENAASIISERVGADLSLEAIAGIGVTQNANAKQKWQLGPLTMVFFSLF